MSTENAKAVPSAPSPPAPRCKICGSDNVVRDAWALWNPIVKDWEVAAVFDHAICLSCDAETDIVFDEVDGPGPDSALRP